MAEGTGSDIQAESSMDVVTAPPGYAILYTRSGHPRLVPEDDYEIARAEEGLLTIQYDIDRSLEEWKAAWAAAGTAVDAGIAEMRKLGYMSPTNATVLNEAVGKARDLYSDLLQAIGAIVPTEGTIASLADHVSVHGEPDDTMPQIKLLFDKYAELVRNFPADRLAEIRAQAAADLAEQGQTQPTEEATATVEEGV